MAIHHTFKQGQKVYVILKDGTTLVDRYREYDSKFIHLYENKIKWSDIRSTTIYKVRK